MNQMDINKMRLTKIPMEPSELPNIHIGYDWLGQDIYSDDGDDYIEHEGDLILDDPEHIRAYLLENAVIKSTAQLYEEMMNYGR